MLVITWADFWTEKWNADLITCYFPADINNERLSIVYLFVCRECQVKHWPKHKKTCQLLAEATERTQKERATAPTET